MSDLQFVTPRTMVIIICSVLAATGAGFGVLFLGYLCRRCGLSIGSESGVRAVTNVSDSLFNESNAVVGVPVDHEYPPVALGQPVYQYYNGIGGRP